MTLCGFDVVNPNFEGGRSEKFGETKVIIMHIVTVPVRNLPCRTGFERRRTSAFRIDLNLC